MFGRRRIWGWSSQRALVVGASHGEQPLQGVGGVRVLHGALGLQVTDEGQHGLQQLLLGKLQHVDTQTTLSNASAATGRVAGQELLNIPDF